MYEQHFSLTAAPFRLQPDTAFFHDAGQHRAILRGLLAPPDPAKPFLVLSGELGTGKSTLLQRWEMSCGEQGMRIARVVSTQLPARDLLMLVCQGFGKTFEVDDRVPMATALSRVFDTLDRAPNLLLVDEAQNLDADGFCALVDLARAAQAADASLTICLAGQPELRARLASPALADLRSKVRASWHLVGLAPDQTQAYVLHRLACSGWTGRPTFDADAFAQIQRATQGVPRRINVLCDRLLLTQFLNKSARVDGPAAAEAAVLLELELDGGSLEGRADPLLEATPNDAQACPAGALMLVAAGRSDHIKAMALLAALQRQPERPLAVLVSVTHAQSWSINQHLLHGAHAIQVVLAQGAGDRPVAEGLAAAFGRLLSQRRPRALVFFDGNPLSQMCASAGHEHLVPMVHVRAATGAADPLPAAATSRAAIGSLADLCFDSGGQSDPGAAVPMRSVRSVGNLLVDAVRVAVESGDASGQGLAPPPPFAAFALEPRGYAVVALRRGSDLLGEHLDELLTLLSTVSRDLSLVWPVQLPAGTGSRPSAQARLAGQRIHCIDELGHAQFIHLVIGATCVLTDSCDVMEEAAALRVPCLSLNRPAPDASRKGGWMRTIPIGLCARRGTRAVWELLFRGVPDLPLPAGWDGHAGLRMSAVLMRWLQERSPPVFSAEARSAIPPG